MVANYMVVMASEVRGHMVKGQTYILSAILCQTVILNGCSDFLQTWWKVPRVNPWNKNRNVHLKSVFACNEICNPMDCPLVISAFKQCTLKSNIYFLLHKHFIFLHIFVFFISLHYRACMNISI